MFERAIELDAGYGPAWAGLATVHATLYEWFGARTTTWHSAERASQRALELAPGLAEAHVARGCALSLSRRYEEAAREFEAAIRLNPQSVRRLLLLRANQLRARRHRALGRAVSSRRPTFVTEDFQSPIFEAQSLRMLGQTDEAGDATREGIARAERDARAQPDRRPGALARLGGPLRRRPDRHEPWSGRGARSSSIPTTWAPFSVPPACTSNAARKKKRWSCSSACSRAAGASGTGSEHDPDYDIVRDDPRFQSLLIASLK